MLSSRPITASAQDEQRSEVQGQRCRVLRKALLSSRPATASAQNAGRECLRHVVSQARMRAGGCRRCRARACAVLAPAPGIPAGDADIAGMVNPARWALPARCHGARCARQVRHGAPPHTPVRGLIRPLRDAVNQTQGARHLRDEASQEARTDTAKSTGRGGAPDQVHGQIGVHGQTFGAADAPAAGPALPRVYGVSAVRMALMRRSRMPAWRAKAPM
ncbi:hypothetical protein C8E08_0884 [Paracidovorax citrulli]|nr:hypothetical protein C8E08_0884 [Paracidovorax citrulli]REG67441.1 hypothetical protein C8E07_0503 [Paracidovorax citrulli]RLJ92001.1 hypothetical protein C8E06_0504 [Paracidovorax citrulli]